MSLLRYALLAGVALFAAQNLQAQAKPKAYKRGGLDFFKEKQYTNAVKALETYYQADPTDDDIWYALGVSYYKTNQLPQAAKLFDGILRADAQENDDVFLYRAQVAHHLGEFKTAAQYYKRYLSKIDDGHSLYAHIIDEVRRAGFGERLGPTGGVLSAYSENLGGAINTAYDEFHPLLSPNYQDRMYFSSSRSDAMGGRFNELGFANKHSGSYRSDMYSGGVDNGRWTAIEKLNYLLNSEEYDVALDFASQGKVLIFWQGKSLYSGDIHVDTFKSNDEARTLHAPIWHDSPIRSHKGDNDPHIFNDTIMIFASQRAGGYGGFDLYSSVRRNNLWYPPKNLGPKVNSAYDERSPFLANDGRTLYFSSNRVDRSVGGFDVLRAEYQDQTAEWLEPENVGRSINSAGDELNFRLSINGLEGFFDSDDRSQSFGGRDLYVAYFKEQLAEQGKMSRPITFVQVAEKARLAELLATQHDNDVNIAGDPSASAPRIPIRVNFKRLPYENEGDVNSVANLERARSVIQLLEEHPDSKVVITNHSDEQEPARFRSYFGIKRAEKFAQALVDRGIDASRIQVLSVGSNYPLARNYADGDPNVQGQRANRRLELHFVPGPQYKLQPTFEEVNLPEVLQSDKIDIYHKAQDGLTFRVEVAEQQQRYDNDQWLNLPAPIIQSDGLSGMYRYALGLYNSYFSARQMAEELLGQGFAQAQVVPYVDGRRISIDELPRLTDRYPELNALLQN